MGNPCANDENYRKSHVLALPELEELDTIEVSAPEKLHYQGLVKVPLDKILKHWKADRYERMAQEQMETEMMSDCKLLLESDNWRENNLRSLEEMADIGFFKEKFSNLLKEAEELKEEFFRHTYEWRVEA